MLLCCPAVRCPGVRRAVLSEPAGRCLSVRPSSCRAVDAVARCQTVRPTACCPVRLSDRADRPDPDTHQAGHHLTSRTVRLLSPYYHLLSITYTVVRRTVPSVRPSVRTRPSVRRAVRCLTVRTVAVDRTVPSVSCPCCPCCPTAVPCRRAVPTVRPTVPVLCCPCCPSVGLTSDAHRPVRRPSDQPSPTADRPSCPALSVLSVLAVPSDRAVSCFAVRFAVQLLSCCAVLYRPICAVRPSVLSCRAGPGSGSPTVPLLSARQAVITLLYCRHLLIIIRLSFDSSVACHPSGTLIIRLSSYYPVIPSDCPSVRPTVRTVATVRRTVCQLSVRSSCPCCPSTVQLSVPSVRPSCPPSSRALSAVAVPSTVDRPSTVRATVDRRRTVARAVDSGADRPYRRRHCPWTVRTVDRTVLSSYRTD